MDQKHLEIFLERLAHHPSPRPDLEQYSTPAVIAADILYLALGLGDIADKKVVDLGCGTGIFAIGARSLGAKEVVGVDIDKTAIDVASKNAEDSGVDVRFENVSVLKFEEECDTTIQNPPFGAQKKHADIPFITKALSISPVVYSLHLTKTEDFVTKEADLLGARITHTKDYKFIIPYTHPFHKKKDKGFDVTLFRLVGRKYD
ncbi:MAG: 50S ribosomal protein L11 methyltransferase [Methanobacteriota archaeon]|nr:MAG: 50S ribosomal protein L11 methyltransferase [Euryarchaeota archaeon]